MNNVSIYPLIFQTAHAIHEYITAPPLLVRHLHLQPMNYQTPKRTSWWLVPSHRVPFYKYSKLFFHYIPDLSCRMITGFSFERGLGGQLQGLVDGALLMQSDWYWRRFLNDVMAGVYDGPVRTMSQQSDAQPILLIELYDFNHLHRRILETKKPNDLLLFTFSDKRLNALTIKHPANHQLKPLESLKSCYDMAIRIEMDPDFAWYWMRFTFGVELPDNYTEVNIESTTKLWQSILSPWMPLIA